MRIPIAALGGTRNPHPESFRMVGGRYSLLALTRFKNGSESRVFPTSTSQAVELSPPANTLIHGPAASSVLFLKQTPWVGDLSAYGAAVEA